VAALLIRLIIVVAVLQPPAPQKDKPAVDEARIRWVLNDEEGIDRKELTKVGGLSPAAFPLYARILDNPKEDPNIVAGILWCVKEIKADRSQFLDRAVTRLADVDNSVRRTALSLLAQIGSARDEAPIVALLSDKEWTNAIAAAKTLAAIGDRRALAAMDVWLATSTPHGDRNARFDVTFRQDIAKYRDQLKARLEKEKKEKKDNPPGK